MRTVKVLIVCAIAMLSTGSLSARTSDEMRRENPELFHDRTGLRISRQRGPTPTDIPGPSEPIDVAQARALIENGALALDVFGAAQSRYDELSGQWLVSEPRLSVPGAVWLPETGRGVLTDDMQNYLARELARRVSEPEHPIVVFCVADCWMSWNAAQRIAAMGYARVYWFRLGTDGWIEQGLPLAPVDPVPVAVD